MCKILFCLLLCIVLASDVVVSQNQPSIVEITPNQTNSFNGWAEFACKIADIGGHKVLWKRTNYSSLFEPELISTNTTLNTTDRRFSINYNWLASTYNLKLDRIRPGDAGTYICEIPTNDGNITRETMLELEQPFFYGNSTLSDVEINEGNELTIECYAGGSPLPTVTISRTDGQPIYENVTFVVGNVLKFENITEKQEANYSCVAENSKGNETRIISVDVPTSPSIETCKLGVTYEPNFNALVECEIVSDNMPNITWFKDGEKLEPNNSNFIPKMADKMEFFVASLNISGESPEYGFYTITATNEIGDDESIVAFVNEIPASSCPDVEETSCFVYILLMVIFLIIILVIVVAGVVYIRKIKQNKQEGGNRPGAVTYRMPKNYE